MVDHSILWLRLVAVELFLRLVLQVVVHLLLAVFVLSAVQEESARRDEGGGVNREASLSSCGGAAC